MIKLSYSNTTICTYKYTEGEIWPAFPQETERFTTSDEFRKIDLKIFNHLLETNTAFNKPENEADIIIEDEYSDIDDTDADPDYEPISSKDLLSKQDKNFENEIVMASDNNETDPRINDNGIIIFNFLYLLYIILFLLFI